MKSALSTLLVAVLASGCAPTLAQFDSERVPSDVLAPAPGTSSDGWATLSAGHLLVQARWRGAGRPLVTGFDIFGRVNRFVVPYTRQAWELDLKMVNLSPAPVTVRSRDWRLEMTPGARNSEPLALSYFKSRWPTEAVRSEAMMLDQALAIGHVIRTHWGERTLGPGETASGILPFAAGPELPGSAKLIWSAGPAPVVVEFGGPR